MLPSLLPESEPERIKPQPVIWRLQSMLTAYLPLVLMLFLAAGTWWLVKNTPKPDGPGEAQALRHEPDYQMENFELQRFSASGALSARISGRELRHYPDTDTLEIDGVELHGLGKDGSLMQASAKRAISNADGSNVQMLGDVHVQRFASTNPDAGAVPQLDVRGEFMQAFTAVEQVRSHLPVVLKTPHGEYSAQSFDYDNLNGMLHFGGRSHASFVPEAPTRGKGRP
ncbi:MAG: LPS export ABC transporter periplasmic protein LptC [Burkholderiaceae bacterium]|nr:LPS export ABC transporter periplasmic protein LptC [Burkholderiaceae bacterium]